MITSAKIKGILHLIINLAGNGTIWTMIPEEYKMYALFVFNLVQIIYAFLDPTYTLAQLGMKKEEYLGRAFRK